jgi:opacity protein-like surface antigen
MLLALAPAAQADDVDFAPEPQGWGWYVSVFGGWSMPDNDIDASFTSGTGTTFVSTAAEIDLDNGFMAGLAVGAQFSPWLRGEVEVSGHWHDAEGAASLYYYSSASVFTTVTADLSGEANALFLLANLWVDLPVGEVIRPYIGGGVGLGRLDVDFSTTAGSVGVDDSDWALAYQLGAGIDFNLSANISIDAGYQYKVIHDAELEAAGTTGAFDIHTDYKSHNILLGLRFGF